MKAFRQFHAPAVLTPWKSHTWIQWIAECFTINQIVSIKFRDEDRQLEYTVLFELQDFVASGGFQKKVGLDFVATRATISCQVTTDLCKITLWNNS